MGKNEDEINLLDTNGDNYVSVLRYFCCCCWMNLVVVVNAFRSWNNAGRMGHFTLVIGRQIGDKDDDNSFTSNLAK